MSEKNEKIKLTVKDKSYDLSMHEGTIGPEVINISKLYSESGNFTYDPGFTSTASCKSKITFIDGEEGILLYRGYPIDQIAEKGNFLETCYLLLNGELPNSEEFAKKIMSLPSYPALTDEQIGIISEHVNKIIN